MGGLQEVALIEVFTLAICEFCQRAAKRLLTITWEEPNERIDAIT